MSVEAFELCRSCGYNGTLDSYDMARSVYQDIACPKCGSTNNQHNSDYQRELFASMREEPTP